MSNILQQSVQQQSLQQTSQALSPNQLKKKLDQAKEQLKVLTGSQAEAEKAFQELVPFKDGWINSL